MTKPLLSIGIIFKNEIRCLERCLKSLQPLREAIPCELVMADTGADDGSRAVAEKYADIIFDFPWINDFSAARNAVMDRCSGTWYMSIDCDEWVDKNIEGFVTFLTTDRKFDFASVIIRNYDTEELDKEGSYSDFLATRLVRLSTGLRYEGAIHEHWPYKGDLRTIMIRGAVFHHDGYVYQDQEMLKQKQERNMTLLKEQLEKDPNNLVILTQCVESSANMPEQEGYLRRALVGIDEKWSLWELFGPPLYRYAVRMAMRDHFPELEEWISKAETTFPDSIFIRVEIAYFAFGHAWNTDDYVGAIRWGERYLQGVEDYHAGRFDRADLLASSLDKTDSHSKNSVATVLASGYLHEKQPEKCVQLMERLDPRELDTKQIGDCVNNFCCLRHEFGVETAPQIIRFWDQLAEHSPSRDKADQRKNAFIKAGIGVFSKEYRQAEQTDMTVIFPAWTVFLPLAGKCLLGDASDILSEKDGAKLAEKLSKVEQLDRLPVSALYHALERVGKFPLPGRPMNIEELDRIVSRLAQDKERFISLAIHIVDNTDTGNWQELLWARGLVLAAVQTYPWNIEGQDKEQGLAIVRSFARLEKEFLPRCYATDVLREDGLFALPSLHRFGWYCAQAFDALEQGNTVEYIRLLRKGLKSCENVKNMVEFLIDHTPEVQITPPPSDELKALVDKVRMVLANFSPDDPAVAALKQSEAYKTVAYLIEGINVPVVGGLLH